VSTISTHVLDTALGKPAGGVPVTLERATDDMVLGSGATDADGRLGDLVPRENPVREGVYRIRFDVAPYFAATKREALYPEIVIVFRVTSDEHYHIPLLLSPFGYSTYRGS
jgi:5-hydroxyisourate hydrolase